MDYTEEYDFYKKYLVDGEYVLWEGKPEKGNIFNPAEIPLMIFSVVWLAFSLFWELTVIKSGAPIIFSLWGLPFIAIGVYLLVGRFIQKVLLRNKTYYVITNKNIIVKAGSKIKIYNGSDLPSMDIEIHKNGNGTIIFYQDVYIRRNSRYNNYFMLENIADVTQAQNSINRMETYQNREKEVEHF